MRLVLLDGLVYVCALGKLEGDSALVVLLAGGFQVEIDEGDLATVVGRQIVNRLAENGIVRHFQRAAIFEDEKRRRQRRIVICRGCFLGVLNGAQGCGRF